MNGQEVSYRQESQTFSPPCKRTTTTIPFSTPAVSAPKNVRTLNRAPLRLGDHVHAEPYWSDVDEAEYFGSGDIPFSYIWYNAAAGGFPLSVCGSEMQGCGEIKGVMNVWRDLPILPPTFRSLPTASAAQWDLCQRMADTKARANLNKALVNLPLLFAERKQTLKMIGSSVEGLLRIARDAQKRDISRYRRAIGRANKRDVSRQAANAHLELIFGMLPLIDEIEGAVEFLGLPTLDFIRSRGLFGLDMPGGTHNAEHLVKWPFSTSIIGPNNQNNFAKLYDTGVAKKRISVRTALRFKLETQLSADARRLGFEPIGAAFDLIPLSFLVGWVSNLDDVIKGMAPLIGVEFETGSRNRRRRTVGSQTVAVAPYPTTAYYGLQRKWTKAPEGANVVSSSLRKQDDVRTVLTAPPELSLHWDVDVGVYEVAAGLSLMIQRYVKPMKRLFKSKSFRYYGPRPKWLADITYRKI